MQEEAYRSVDHILEEVRAMRVKGGSAFGVAAAQAFNFVAQDQKFVSAEELYDELEHVASLLFAEKPTMATIHNAYQLIVAGSRSRVENDNLPMARKEITDRAERFIEHSRDAIQQLGRIGSNLVLTDQTIMMHSYSASVLSIFETAWQTGKRFRVICTESRPLRESRMAASRLSQLGVPVIFVTDASMAVSAKEADWILVGADSIAIDGAVANKTGTDMLSIVAERFDIPFYVTGEVLKLRRQTREGLPIVLEQRPASEIVGLMDFEHTENITVINQFFDLTPPRRIRAIITELGIFSPGQINLAWLAFQEEFEGISR